MKKFLAGSAIASIYTTDDKLIAISNTQINDTINLSVESQEVRSGYGNALDYIYYHSTRMEGQLEDAQFNLDYIKHNLGATETNKAQVYESKSFKMTQGSVVVTGVKGTLTSGKGKVWVYYNDEPYTFDAVYNSDNDSITIDNSANRLVDKDVCIKYLTTLEDGQVRNLTIAANFIPNIVKIVLEAQLFASESGAANSSRIGKVLFTIPKAQLSGTQEISMSASGVASTPLSYLALKSDMVGDDACASAAGVYGYITQILETGEWYSGVEMLAIEAVDDGFTATVGNYINTYAILGNSNFIVKPRTNLRYGHKATGAASITWVEDDLDTKLGLDGEIRNGIAVGDTIYVKVVDKSGADVTSIAGDAAVVTARVPAAE